MSADSITFTLDRHQHPLRLQVTPRRLVTASHVLKGKTVKAALALVPLLFSLCPAAQQAVARQALWAAAGIPCPPEERQQQRILLARETLRELALPMLLHWPLALGEAADPVAARRLLSASCGTPVADLLAWLAPPLAGTGDLHAFVHSGSKGSPATPPWAVALCRQLQKWCDTDGGLLARQILPAATPRFLSEADAPAIEAALRADEDGSFRRFPLLDGKTAETGPLARQWHHLVVAETVSVYGCGLLARMLARMADLRAAADILMREEEQGDPGQQPQPTPAGLAASLPLPALPETGCGEGFALGGSARGLLAHYVRVKDGIIADWRVVAPSEWTCHPDGDVVNSIDHADEERIRWLLRLLDPCVACHLVVS